MVVTYIINQSFLKLSGRMVNGPIFNETRINIFLMVKGNKQADCYPVIKDNHSL